MVIDLGSRTTEQNNILKEYDNKLNTQNKDAYTRGKTEEKQGKHPSFEKLTTFRP